MKTNTQHTSEPEPPERVEQDRDELRVAITEHFRAASAWTAEFQSGGRFHHALPIGVDITVAGGIWLVAQVAALTEEQTRLRAALEFYEAIENYWIPGEAYESSVGEDYGQRARSALQPPTPREEPTS